ncbi:kelch-like protein 12 isoform X1 [Styela clava]
MEVERTIPMDKNAHDAELLENLNRMRENKMFCDFLIKVGSEEIPVHKNVVSAGSDYFKAMLSHDTKESQAGIVDIKESNPVCVKKCIDFIYTGNGSVADGNREELMLVAHMMQLQRLCDGIAVFLANDLGSGSFVSTQRIASMFNCVNLKEHCNAFALENFCSVVLSEDFKLLEDDYFRFLMKAENVKASTPDKCKALIAWIQHEPDNRAKCFEEIFKTFDFSNLSFEYMTYLVEKEPLVSNSLPCVKLLFATVTGKGGNVQAKKHSVKTGPSSNENNVIAVFDRTSKSIQCFSPERKTWTKMREITAEIMEKHVLAVVLGNDIYVLGYDGRNYRLLNYADTSATWEILADRANVGRTRAVVLDGSIYAFDDSSNSSKAVETYRPSNNSWVHLIDKPVPACYCAVVAADGFIYCIGGYNRHSISDILKLDPAIPKWYTLPNMPSVRCFASAVPFDQAIYVLGGTPWTGTLATVICFDIKSENWTSVTNMNNARQQLGSCIFRDKIYVIGGVRSSDTIEEYDHDTKKWKLVGSLSGKIVNPEASVALYLQT